MRDFTPETYSLLVSALEEKGYSFYTFEKYLTDKPARAVVLRHDVDRQPRQALLMAELEYGRKIEASYHFRVTTDKGIHAEVSDLKKIISMGHEVAYHYEDLSLALKKIGGSRFARLTTEDFREGVKKAMASFVSNLSLLRQYYPVRVISMHGDPLSSYDNRKLWDHISYANCGIICEAYLDIDYNEVFYLTDTGRRWDAARSNRRDSVLKDIKSDNVAAQRLDQAFHSTFDLIRAVELGETPDRMIINTHPQRWNGRVMPWINELVGQNIRNVIKSTLFR